MNAITSGDANQQRDGIDTSDRIDFSSSTAARRVADRLSRLPNPGALSRNYRIRYPHQDEERGEDTNEDSNRQNQRSNRDDGGSSPMGFISQLIHQNPELSGVVKAFEKYIPFVLIAAAKGFFDHATGIPSVPNTKPHNYSHLVYLNLLMNYGHFIYRNICVYCVDCHVFSC